MERSNNVFIIKSCVNATYLLCCLVHHITGLCNAINHTKQKKNENEKFSALFIVENRLKRKKKKKKRKKKKIQGNKLGLEISVYLAVDHQDEDNAGPGAEWD